MYGYGSRLNMAGYIMDIILNYNFINSLRPSDAYMRQ